MSTPLYPTVCALDFSKGSEAALVRAADLAGRTGAPLHLLHAVPSFHAGAVEAPQPEVPLHEVENRMLAFASNALGWTRTPDAPRPVRTGRAGAYAGDIILDYARDVDAELLVLGTHGRRGVRHLLIGSIAEEVVRRAPCPVLAVPNRAGRAAPGPHAPVLVPVDFSAPSQRALAHAKTVAALFAAPVELVHVLLDTGPFPPFYLEGGVLPPSALEGAIAEAKTRLAQFDAEAGGTPATRYHVVNGVPHREIVALAKGAGQDASGQEGAGQESAGQSAAYGMIVMATHGLTGLKHALIGSVTERTLRRAPCPVLAVRLEDDG